MANDLVKQLVLHQELQHRPAENTEELLTLFTKTCVNGYPAIKNDKRPMLYRRNDLTTWAQEAFDRGEPCFYAEPVDPKRPNGKLRLCEPEYKYKLSRMLDESEFELLKQYLTK